MSWQILQDPVKRTAGDAIFSFIAQDIKWVRGTATPTTILLNNNNDRAVTFTTEKRFHERQFRGVPAVAQE